MITVIICGSSWNWLGKTLVSMNGTISPLEFSLVDNTSFHGQTLFKEPIRKPVNAATVTSWYLLNSQFKNLEKESNPTTQPTPKVSMVVILKSLIEERISS